MNIPEDYQALVVQLLDAPLPPTRPTFVARGDCIVATYRSSRLTFRREAVQKLPPGGVLLIRVRPREAEGVEGVRSSKGVLREGVS